MGQRARLWLAGLVVALILGSWGVAGGWNAPEGTSIATQNPTPDPPTVASGTKPTGNPTANTPLPVPTQPTLDDQGGSGRYRLSLDTVTVEVDAQQGGRIIAFALDGENLLRDNSVDPQNYGSTFWVSPQAIWDWPPVPEIDRAPYQVLQSDRSLRLVSQPSPSLGIQVSKSLALGRFRADGSPTLRLTYRITNTHTHPLRYAPWEVSRVSPTGVTFYPTGSALYGSGSFGTPLTETSAGVTWWNHDSAPLSQDQKLFAEGFGGWLAHLDGDKLFLKTFPDITAADQAPRESEIEVYANGNHTYVEMEAQGAYTRLAPGESLEWTVGWSVHRVPATIPPVAGSGALVDWVTGLL
ncbi:DUF4380 domain-containing protein [Prochlorothrix hollandica]|uniref:DUF4380 domain-containing protein n=1 Tax=Prochlorothrix hollandica PCC 9006 = CALU 1027 TaxID=317619 RepID=A0A0M2PXQ1_PROHO|nr:DUF4380 domain-containing protein [Prochlorothrix hollandica]KKI99161.1 hypothetical protein PROH_15465 [Prochlorothrix hollandica PCC 9006 = CALU 1027]